MRLAAFHIFRCFSVLIVEGKVFGSSEILTDVSFFEAKYKVYYKRNGFKTLGECKELKDIFLNPVK